MLAPASQNFHSISTGQKVIVPSLTVACMSGTHCHHMLETYATISAVKYALKRHLFNQQVVAMCISASSGNVYEQAVAACTNK